MTKQEKHENYTAFVQKFQPKLTTDDCLTPPLVYEAVKAWALQTYSIDPAAPVLRPFWPGADYTQTDYSGAVVIDNPPFSILARIVDFFRARAIPFFLFAPALTAMGYTRRPDVTVLYIAENIVYENGAKIGTAFLTNMEPQTTARSAPDLHVAVAKACKATQAAKAKDRPPTYVYPPNILIGSHFVTLARYGIPFACTRANSVRISALQSQREAKKAIYGSGLLISEKKAREAADRTHEAAARARQEALAHATIWPLSPEEKAIIQTLD